MHWLYEEVWRQDLLLCSNVPGDAAAIADGAGRLQWRSEGEGGVALSFHQSAHFPSLIAIGGIILFATYWRNGRGLRSAEYFALMVLLSPVSWQQHDGAKSLKSFLAALIGLGLCDAVGVDANTEVYRFTFDGVHLSDGVQFIVVVIGPVLDIRNILLMLERTSSGRYNVVRKTGRMLLFSQPERRRAVYRHCVLRCRLCRRIARRRGDHRQRAITYMTEKNSAAAATKASAKGYSRRL